MVLRHLSASTARGSNAPLNPAKQEARPNPDRRPPEKGYLRLT
jgi:hypothetical protein